MLRNPNLRPVLIFSVFTCTFIILLYFIFFEGLSYQTAVSVLPRSLLFSTIVILAVIVLDGFLSKSNLLKWLPFVPHFGGRWEGWNLSELSPPENWKPICIEIKQGFFITANSISFDMERLSKAESYSLTSAEYSQNADFSELIYTYRTVVGGDSGVVETEHTGTFILRMKKSRSDFLEGEYYTNTRRYGGVPGTGTRGTWGRIVLARSKKPYSGHLDFDVTSWARPKPRLESVNS